MSRHEFVSARLRSAALVAAAMATSITASVYIARAQPGQSTRPELAFAGTLQGVKTPTKLVFHFKKAGAEVCQAAFDSGPIAENGGFRALVPLDKCPADLFDGNDLTYDIDVGGTAGLVKDSQVGAVPYAKYADQVGYADCPVGYQKAPSSAERPNITVCQKGNDQIVKVGSGPSSFWIDRYEASVWSDPEGTKGAQASATPFGVEDGLPNYPGSFPANGQITNLANMLYAVSRARVLPSGNVTWFQANLACLASGKRLPSGQEWLLAATGTADPIDNNDGTNGTCLTSVPEGGKRRQTASDGAASQCASVWGAEDMVGNLWELTSEWYVTLGISTSIPKELHPWTSDYNKDATFNVVSSAISPPGSAALGMPAAMSRGGSYKYGTDGGIFAVYLNDAPSQPFSQRGFRCVITR